MMGFGWGFGGLAMVFMMLFWVFVVALAVWLLSRLFPAATNALSRPTGHPDGAAPPAALDIVKQRYARGEISKADYEEMAGVLKT